MLQYDIGTATDIGRREINEDRHFLVELPSGAWLVGVCDGVGGHAGGEVASDLAVTLLTEKAPKWKVNKSPEAVADVMEDALRQVHDKIRQKAHRDKALSGMATTICCALLRSDDVLQRYAGDSTLFWSRNERLLYRTPPHVIDDKLFSCLGGAGRPHISPQRSGEYDWQLKIKAGDTLVLCSDGLLHTLAEPTLLAMFAEPGPAAELASRLVAAALKAGESDNITVVAVRVTS